MRVRSTYSILCPLLTSHFQTTFCIICLTKLKQLLSHSHVEVFKTYMLHVPVFLSCTSLQESLLVLMVILIADVPLEC